MGLLWYPFLCYCLPSAAIEWCLVWNPVKSTCRGGTLQPHWPSVEGAPGCQVHARKSAQKCVCVCVTVPWLVKARSAPGMDPVESSEPSASPWAKERVAGTRLRRIRVSRALARSIRQESLGLVEALLRDLLVSAERLRDLREEEVAQSAETAACTAELEESVPLSCGSAVTCESFGKSPLAPSRSLAQGHRCTHGEMMTILCRLWASPLVANPLSTFPRTSSMWCSD